MHLINRISRRKDAPRWIFIALAVLVLAAFAPTLGYDFIDYDDPLFITTNPHVKSGLSAENFRWAWTAELTRETKHADRWMPATFLSHMLAVELFGLDGRGHHAVNLLLHLLNTLLLFQFLRRTTGALWTSGLAAAIFAIHPVQVESVAWITQRKTVLCALFFFLTLHAYAAYARRPTRGRYSAILIAYAAALLSKAAVVTLPILLLFLDYWPLKRLHPRRPRDWAARLWEKIPLFLMAAVAAAHAALMSLGDTGPFGAVVMPLGVKVGSVLVNPWAYLGKALWPAGLAAFYPHPGWRPAWLLLLAAAGLLASIAAALSFGKRRPYAAVGWFWFLVALAPTSGMLQVGYQAMADRYLYLPLIGLAVLAAWGSAEFAEQRPRWRRTVVPLACAAGVAVLSVLCTIQARRWKDSETLFTHALKVTRRNYKAQRTLGLAALAAGRIEEAARRLEISLDILPASPNIRGVLGGIYLQLDRLDDAEEEFRTAVRLKPNGPQIQNNLGVLRLRQKRHAEALEFFEKAVRLDPDYVRGRVNLGMTLAAFNRREEAAGHLTRALQLDPENRQAREVLRRLMAVKTP